MHIHSVVAYTEACQSQVLIWSALINQYMQIILPSSSNSTESDDAGSEEFHGESIDDCIET